jgi:hypothetical protein
MKKSTIYLVLAGMLCALLFTGCSKDDNQKYKVTGRLLKACDDPIPVAGVELILHYDGGYSDAKDLATTTTDANGNFEFGYGGVSRILDIYLSINGESAAGLGSRVGYMGGIPRNQDIDAGTLYATRNFFAVAKVSVQRQTSTNDTIYYNSSNGKFLKMVVGPFTDKQVIDTVIYQHGVCYGGCESPNLDVPYKWKFGANGKTIYIGAPMIPCTQQEFLIELK